jgi:hypothetical protein
MERTWRLTAALIATASSALVVSASLCAGVAGASDVAPIVRTVPEHTRSPRVVHPTPLSLSAPAGLSAFAGMGPCLGGVCYTPGEPTVAVGPNDVVQAVNAAVTVYDKSGVARAELDFDSFWGGETEYCVDPRVLYIGSVERFAISCTDITTPTSPMRFAISATSDPAGAWYTYAAPNTSFLDQDKIEATADKLIIAGNAETTEQIYVYELSEVASGASAPAVVGLVAKKSNVYEAAVQQTPAADGYLVSSFPGGKLYLATVTGTPAAHDVHVSETTVKSKFHDYPAPQEPATSTAGSTTPSTRPRPPTPSR